MAPPACARQRPEMATRHGSPAARPPSTRIPTRSRPLAPASTRRPSASRATPRPTFACAERFVAAAARKVVVTGLPTAMGILLPACAGHWLWCSAGVRVGRRMGAAAGLPADRHDVRHAVAPRADEVLPVLGGL